MEKEKNIMEFPLKKIKISFIIAAVFFIICAVIIKNQASVCVRLADTAANFGYYDAAKAFLGGIDTAYESDYYNMGLYDIASEMYDHEDYDEACDIFKGLGDYSDSADRMCQCIQKKAELLINDGDYLTASSLLKDIMYYSGSEDIYNECQYRYALGEAENGDWFNSAQILWGIRDYKDSMARAKDIVMQNTGSDDVEKTVGSGRPISPELLNAYMELKDKRKQLKDGAIAAGYYHTVGLKKDGRVISCGSNEKGQCGTDSWQNVVQVAAGGYHTVGLLSDGTVVACGDNSCGQCNVGEWKNVVQIKTTDYNTAALLSDGTVVTCGFNKLIQTDGWTGIDSICGGAYALCGLSAGGDLFYTHPSCKMEQQLIDADVSVSYAVGLTLSGDVVYSYETPCKWDKAVSVYAGGDTVGIIDMSFKPSVYNRKWGEYYRLPQGKAVSVSLGSTHFAVLYDDGSVYCYGENNCGQCDTSGWNLN
jgi:hypothetical protein